MTHDTPPKRIWACYDESFDATYWAGPDVVYATDHFVGEYILASEANAMVAAALREAAREVDLRYAEGAMGNPGHYIAPLIPQPASAALDKLIAAPAARGMERAETHIAAIERLAISASIASCTCLTKTPDITFHAADCRYVYLQYIIAQCEDFRAANGATP